MLGVDVAEEEVEGLNALLEAFFDVGPISMRNDARNDVEGKNFFNASVVALHVECDAHVHQGQFGGLMAFLEFVFGEFAEFFEEQSRAGMGRVRRFKEFVVKSAEFIR